VFPEKLILSVGNKSDTYKIGPDSRKPTGKAMEGEIFSKTPPLMAMVGAAFLPIIMGIKDVCWATEAHLVSETWRLAKGGSGSEAEDAPSTPYFSAKGFSWEDFSHTFDGAVGAISGIITSALVKAFLDKYISEKSIEPVGQKNPAAKIELDHEGRVVVNSRGNSVLIGIGESGKEEPRMKLQSSPGAKIDNRVSINCGDSSLELRNAADPNITDRTTIKGGESVIDLCHGPDFFNRVVKIESDRIDLTARTESVRAKGAIKHRFFEVLA
jgi:hypothetical protein